MSDSLHVGSLGYVETLGQKGLASINEIRGIEYCYPLEIELHGKKYYITTDEFVDLEKYSDKTFHDVAIDYCMYRLKINIQDAENKIQKLQKQINIFDDVCKCDKNGTVKSVRIGLIRMIDKELEDFYHE